MLELHQGLAGVGQRQPRRRTEAYATSRARLIARIARDGFAQVMEAVAYTWFNRFTALRYMDARKKLF